MAEKGTAPAGRAREGTPWLKPSSPEQQNRLPPLSRPPNPFGAVDRDGPARYSGHERRLWSRKQGGTVEFYQLHP